MWLLFVLLLALAHQVIFRGGRLEDLSARLAARNYDGLTRLPIAAPFSTSLSRWRGAEQQQQPLAVIQLDIDHFKKVNDSWGHHARGDQALMRVAGVIKHTLRPTWPDASAARSFASCCRTPRWLRRRAWRASAAAGGQNHSGQRQHHLSVTLSAGVSCSEQGSYHAESLQAGGPPPVSGESGGRNRVRGWLDFALVILFYRR